MNISLRKYIFENNKHISYMFPEELRNNNQPLAMNLNLVLKYLYISYVSTQIYSFSFFFHTGRNQVFLQKRLRQETFKMKWTILSYQRVQRLQRCWMLYQKDLKSSWKGPHLAKFGVWVPVLTAVDWNIQKFI